MIIITITKDELSRLMAYIITADLNKPKSILICLFNSIIPDIATLNNWLMKIEYFLSLS
jgi:hypothetical protein